MAINSERTIGRGSLVTLHFSLTLTSGEVIDSNFSGRPPNFRMGDGTLLPGFEDCLVGMQTGEEREFILSPGNAFGLRNDANRQRFGIDKFKHLLEDDLIPLQVGAVVSFKDAAGYDLPGVVSALDKDTVEVDFNHPLAGKKIIFRVRIINVLDADAQQLEVKL